MHARTCSFHTSTKCKTSVAEQQKSNQSSIFITAINRIIEMNGAVTPLQMEGDIPQLSHAYHMHKKHPISKQYLDTGLGHHHHHLTMYVFVELAYALVLRVRAYRERRLARPFTAWDSWVSNDTLVTLAVPPARTRACN